MNTDENAMQRHPPRFLPLFLLLALIALGGRVIPIQSTLAQDSLSLVAVSLNDSEDLAQFDALGLPVYNRLLGSSGEYLLTGASTTDLKALRATTLVSTVLDSNTGGDSYYLAYPPIGRSAPDWEAYGEMLLDDDVQVLMRLTAEGAQSLSELGVEIVAVTFDPKPLYPAGNTNFPAAITPDPIIQGMIDQVNYTTVYSYIGGISGEWAVTIGGLPYTISTRNTNSGETIQKATQFVGEHLTNLGLIVEYHQWGGPTYPNVIAELPGMTNPDDIYIIGAHLDDMPSQGRAPGADDNASGSVATLIAADILSQYQWDCTLRFALWTGEEQGLNGSYAYAQRSYNQGENILGYLNLDMIAWNTVGSSPDIDLHARSTVPGSMEIAQLFADTVDAYGLNLIPTIIPNGIPNSDHSSFWAFGYPAILAIEDNSDFNPYYHTINDDMDNFQDWPYYVEFVRAAIGTFAHMTGCLVPEADFTLEVTSLTQEICLAEEAEYEASLGEILNFTDPVTLSVEGNPEGTTVDFSENPVVPADPPATSILTISNTAAAVPGSYSLDVIGMAPTSTHTATAMLELNAVPPTVTLVSPADGEVDVDTKPYFEWGAAERATAYQLEVATDPDFSEVVYSATVMGTGHQMSEALASYTEYYWRVEPENVCGTGMVSEVSSFRTYLIPPILVVDDDDDGPDVLEAYTSTLDALGRRYDVWDTGSGNDEPGETELANYKAVIWFTGDKYNSTTGPGAAGEAALVSWLDGGGCFFLSSQDYLVPKTPDDFTAMYLGLGEYDQDVGHLNVTGKGSVFGGLGPYGLSYPYTNYSDEVNPNESAEIGFEGPKGEAALVKEWEGFKSTFWAFPFEALSESGREESLSAVLEWCLVYGLELEGEQSQEGQPGETISYTLTVTNTGISDVISLTVSGGEWTTTLSESSVLLGSGESAEVLVSVEIPADAEGGASDVVTVMAVSSGDPLVSASLELTTTVPLEEQRLFLPLVTR